MRTTFSGAMRLAIKEVMVKNHFVFVIGQGTRLNKYLLTVIVD